MVDKIEGEVDPNNPYTKLQKRIYDHGYGEWQLDNRNAMVGTFDAHNAFAGHDLLFKDLDTGGPHGGKVALDFGCGPGRNLVRYHDRFARIDGVDLSLVALCKASDYLASQNIASYKLYHCNGVDLHDVPDNTYDVVFSTITLQHICVHAIRLNYFKEFYRVLKPGAWLTFQMGFGPSHPSCVDYHANHYGAESTNGNCDASVAYSGQLRDDLEPIGFHNFSFQLIEAPPFEPIPLHKHWIITTCQHRIDQHRIDQHRIDQHRIDQHRIDQE